MADKTKVAGQGVAEDYRVPALNDEQRDVEGSESDGSVMGYPKVAATGQMVQPSRYADDELAVNDDVQLADSVVGIVNRGPGEC